VTTESWQELARVGKMDGELVGKSWQDGWQELARWLAGVGKLVAMSHGQTVSQSSPKKYKKSR